MKVELSLHQTYEVGLLFPDEEVEYQRGKCFLQGKKLIARVC